MRQPRGCRYLHWHFGLKVSSASSSCRSPSCARGYLSWFSGAPLYAGNLYEEEQMERYSLNRGQYGKEIEHCMRVVFHSNRNLDEVYRSGF